MERPSSYQDSTRPSCAGVSAPLLFLLPPCILLLAIDIAMRNVQRARALTGPSEDEATSLITTDRLRGLAAKAQKVLADFKEYDRRRFIDPPLSPLSSSWSIRPLELRPLGRSYSDSTVPRVRSTEIRAVQGRKQKTVSPAFMAFCERLLQESRVQKQKKEIQSLKRSLASSKKARHAAAFKTLCDNLLRSNELRRKEREIKELREENDRSKRSQVGVVTRAAKQMVLDVQKDRLVEEFVKDVLKESLESRQALVDLKDTHENEMREIVGIWQKERRQMEREIERLRIAQDAKALEQEISNELEDRLFFEIESDRHVQEIEFDDADTYLEEMSTMSSSSTCVGTPSPSPNKHAHFRTCDVAMRKWVSDPGFGSPSPSRRKVDPSQFDGFSFNPLFFGNAGHSSGSPPSKVRNAADSMESGGPLKPRRHSVPHSTPLRVTWKP